MRYVSTRGRAPSVGFADALLAGLAPDGGLYVPDRTPALEGVEGDRYVDVARSVVGAFAGEGAAALVDDAYGGFDHPDVCPVRELSDGLWVQELWHGPTLAFKDVALQLVGRLFDDELRRRGERVTIVVATSGDTGSAAIDACVGRDTLDIVVLHPAGRVSEVQRRMMTTVDAPNVHNVAIEGTFDDCQDLVKAMFADAAFRDEIQMSAMNSINWARVMAQITYYVTGAAAAAPGTGPVSFAVPTGNFGNVLAGWYARAMGVPIERFLVGSNANDILTRWVESGALVTEQVVPTLSPAMDIQVSSNHERLLFELLGRDGSATADLMRRFRELGSVEAPRDPAFGASRLDDDETLQVIAEVWKEDEYLIDPHTAVGIGAARRLRRPEDGTVVCLSTAHPAKFPDAVEKATGIRPELPERLADLLDRSERYDVLGGGLDDVKAHIRGLVR
jgi:threonine synthase